MGFSARIAFGPPLANGTYTHLLDSRARCPDNNAMVDPQIEPPHRSGFVALIGRPNVGKSTLLNALLEQQIAPVSFRPQTTQQKQLGILTAPDAQLIFIDTPGLHKPLHKLGERMNEYAREALADVDLILVIFDATLPPNEEDQMVVDLLRNSPSKTTCLVVLNKIDLVSEPELELRLEAYRKLLPDSDLLPISATQRDGIGELRKRIIDAIPIGPQYYPEEELTDRNEREIAADLIRAAAMRHLQQELPYSIAVRIDEYKERGETGAFIGATIFVERESQKGIVIGSGGRKLREIGTSAREDIEAMSGRRIYLELRVKVLARWRNDDSALKRLGYRPVRS